MLKKFIALILALLMVSFGLVSCSKKDEEQTSDVVDTTPKGPSELDQVLASFSDESYGCDFLILTSNHVNDLLDCIQAPEEANRGEIITEALFKRDVLVNEKLGITIKYELTGVDPYDMYLAAEKSVTSGDHVYDAVLHDMMSVTKPLATKDYLVPFNTLPNVDLSKPWWNQSAVKDLTINGKLYFATGDISPRYLLSPYIMQFNKRLVSEYSLDDPYKLVDDGKWTVEKLYTMIQNTASEIVQDGTMDKQDFYGLVTDTTATYAFYRGCNMKIADVINGVPTINANTARIDEVTSALANYFGSVNQGGKNPNIYIRQNIEEEDYEEFKIFNSGRAIFVGNTLTNLSMYSKMVDDYGILPMPKFDESQTEYCSYAQPYGAVSIMVLKTNNNLDRTGKILEVMAAVSKYTSTPAAYEQTLKLKRSDDAESGRMIDMIFNSITFDTGTIFRWADIYSDLCNSIMKGEQYINALNPKILRINKQIQLLLESNAFANAQQ